LAVLKTVVPTVVSTQRFEWRNGNGFEHLAKGKAYLFGAL